MKERADIELLVEFGETGSEKAFAELVSRYVDLVYSAATRMLVDRHLSEDVAQAVFVALAKDAAKVARKLGSGAPLSGWLHVTTRNVAAKTIRAEERRRAREREAAAMEQKDAPGDVNLWEQIAPQLDNALGSLQERERAALLMRFFEHKSVKEIAARLGGGEEAMQKRITRALESLRKILVQRGVKVETGALAGVLTANALQAAPASLLPMIAGAAMKGAAIANAGLLTTTIKAIGTFTMTKSQVPFAAGVLAVIVVPISIQQATLREVRATQSETAVQEANQSPNREQVPGNSEEEEIDRLRKVAGELRSQLADKKESASQARNEAAAIAPLLLGRGKTVSLFDLGYAGIETPEASLQSLLACMREGNLDGTLGITVLSPKRAVEMSEALSSEEMQRRLAEEMRKGVLGAVMSQSVQQHEDGTTSAPVEKEVWPENPTGEVSVEIENLEELEEKRVRISARIIRGKEVKTEHFMFGKTRAGWKHLWE